MKSYDHQKIEKQAREIWQQFKVDQTDPSQTENKYYSLDMFPYPSGDGLHVGHWRGYVLSDFYARYQKLQGKNVLHPMGYDAFGLPAENAAIKNKTHPKEFTDQAVQKFRSQLEAIGASFDWTKEINTSAPEYYRWTQWLFLQLFKHGLAEKRKSLVNWCPKDQTVLANEQVVNGCCERCGSKVTKKELDQWYFKTTEFVEELDAALEKLNWPEKVKTLQRNWIGKSEGAEVIFKTENGAQISVFTTRPDTLFGVTALVLAPEHPLVKKLATQEFADKVEAYLKEVASKTNIDRLQAKESDKTATFTGAYALHPLTNKKLPIWVADYVLNDYGTGAIMSVPAHDERDWQFAKIHQLPIVSVIEPEFIDRKEPGRIREDQPFVEREGVIAIVKHWAKDEYLGLKWQKVAWGTWITGGIEKGQTAEEAARTEILEEVGYKNLKLVKDLGHLHSKFYHLPKKENRFLHGQCLFFELVNDEQDQASDLEQAKHQPIWLTKTAVERFLTAEAHQWAWQRLQGQFTANTASGYLVNSGQYDGLSLDEGSKKIVEDLTKANLGKKVTTYRLRDWLVSRQRYWGAPIPIVYNPEGEAQPVKDEHLPLLLPTDVDFLPGGESPIARSKEYLKRAEKLYGAGWHFETDTLDTFVDSSWYFLRYLSPTASNKPFDKDLVDHWLPIDLYVGGIEHATLHLLYARFVCRFLAKYGYIDSQITEPFRQLFNIGMVTLHGAKMSKSKSNVVAADELVKHYGSDALRGYELFLGPMDIDVEWNSRGINGIHRFLIKLYQAKELLTEDRSTTEQQKIWQEYQSQIEPMIKDFRLNTVISSAMVALQQLTKTKAVAKDWLVSFLITLSPIFPHLSEVMFQELGGQGSIFQQSWPKLKEEAAPITITVLINNRFVGNLAVAEGVSQEQIVQQALELARAKNPALNSQSQHIYSPNRALNFIA